MSLGIRARLSAWYAIVLSLALGGCLAGFYAVHLRSAFGRVDADLARAASLVARLVGPELDEGLSLPDAAREALEDIELPGVRLAVADADGRLLSAGWNGLPVIAGAVSAATAEGAFRVHGSRHAHAGLRYAVLAAEPLAGLERELQALRRNLWASFAGALLLAGIGGALVSVAALRPVASLAAQARGLSEQTPGRRLAAPNPGDELGALAASFNDLLARLEAALVQQRQFMADASHELRTPLSVARTAIDVTLAREGRPEAEYREALGVVREQARRLGGIVEDLFTLARADAAGLPLERAALYLDDVVESCVQEARLLAAARGVEVTSAGPSDVEARADERLVRRMLMNLLDNAVRHTRAGSGVRVVLSVAAGAAEVAVTDAGPGIPELDRARIFDRFVQLDASRSGTGAGLGLAIARAVARAHGGEVELRRSDASGSSFVARLPLAGDSVIVGSSAGA